LNGIVDYLCDMNTNKNVPMQKNSKQVHTTTDYHLFKSIDGNRNKNLLHINRLKKSMTENYLFTIIVVNEKYEIIDGQHRFDVIEELKLPLHYVVCDGYGLSEVHILNQNSKTWNMDDFLDGYCSLGYTDYLTYRKFKDDYKLGHHEALALLSGSVKSGKNVAFFEGALKIKSLAEAKKNIDKVLLVSPYYDGCKRRSFIYAMLGLFKNPKFDMTEFLGKLKQQPTALMDLPTTTAYVELIEEIYNYRRRDKINLRY
jgi:hypothetical protein